MRIIDAKEQASPPPNVQIRARKDKLYAKNLQGSEINRNFAPKWEYVNKPNFIKYQNEENSNYHHGFARDSRQSLRTGKRQRE